MKIKKEVFGGLAVVVIITVVIGGLYTYQKYRARSGLAARIADISSKGVPATIDDLRNAIALYEARIEEHLRDAAQTGSYWKILATRFQDRGMHNEALAALERGVYYFPEDPTLQYLTGVSAAMVAKSWLDFSGGSSAGTAPGGSSGGPVNRYFTLAEQAYLNAIKMDDQYTRAMYALGVLYVFELERPEDAIPHMIRHNEIRTRDVDGMFVLARAYFMTGQYEPAIDLYNRIISTTKDKTKRSEAERNKEYIMDIYYG
ncbi:MAG: tetratricopeptide repeat protein [Spirochaetaceae bacterium]|jgi:tetratricopeptide (TPR) repeat protein|nr:tetratricopeptide repeat protein [Spirochaetaceae bacterium]